MQKEKTAKGQESISTEEYLWKRQKIREKEGQKKGFLKKEQKSPAWMLAELYV